MLPTVLFRRRVNKLAALSSSNKPSLRHHTLVFEQAQKLMAWTNQRGTLNVTGQMGIRIYRHKVLPVLAHPITLAFLLNNPDGKPTAS